MLTRFEVEGFRNFSHRFTFNLTDVRDYRFNTSAIEGGIVSCGLIYGKNAVGKTNFSNALLDISANVGRRTFYSNKTNYLSAVGSHLRALLIRSASEMTKLSIVTKRRG